MKADEFLVNPKYDVGDIRSIDDVFAEWDQKKQLPSDDLAGMASMVAILGLDAVVGDGLLNQVSPELHTAMAHLMGEKADTYDEARKLIKARWNDGDKAFTGFVNKIKGQIGEDRFVDQYSDYWLAESKSQKGVDALREMAGSDLYEAAQVKMYAHASDVIDHMRKVQQEVDAELLADGHLVGKLNFAVPEDILAEVRNKMAAYPELAGIDVLPVRTTAKEMADIVRDAGENIAHPMGHLVEDVFESVAFMAAIDALTNAYLLAKGKKTIAELTQQTLIKTPIGTIAIAASKTTALALVQTGVAVNPIMLPMLIAISTRLVMKHWYDSRNRYAVFLKDQASWVKLIGRGIEQKSRSPVFS